MGLSGTGGPRHQREGDDQPEGTEEKQGKCAFHDLLLSGVDQARLGPQS